MKIHTCVFFLISSTVVSFCSCIWKVNDTQTFHIITLKMHHLWRVQSGDCEAKFILWPTVLWSWAMSQSCLLHILCTGYYISRYFTILSTTKRQYFFHSNLTEIMKVFILKLERASSSLRCALICLKTLKKDIVLQFTVILFSAVSTLIRPNKKRY